MRKVIILLLCCCSFFACYMTPTEIAQSEEALLQNQRLEMYNRVVATLDVQTLIYIKDSRTGLCFALNGLGEHLACVPCDALENVTITITNGVYK